MKIPVVTSKIAKKHLENVKLQHAEILRGIAEQSLKLETVRQQNQAMQMDAHKTNSTNAVQKEKNSMDFATKQAELDIKRSETNTV